LLALNGGIHILKLQFCRGQRTKKDFTEPLFSLINFAQSLQSRNQACIVRCNAGILYHWRRKVWSM